MNTFDTPRWLIQESVDMIMRPMGLDLTDAMAKMTDEQLEAFACALGRALSGDHEDED